MPVLTVIDQSSTQAVEMSTKYGASRDASDSITGFVRTKSEGSQISDTAVITQSPPKMLHAQDSSVLDRDAKGGKQDVHAGEDDRSMSGALPRSHTLPEVSTKLTNIASRRGFGLSLSSHFDELTRPSSHTQSEIADPAFHHDLLGVVADGATKHPFIRSSSLGPLTPPHEAESLPWLPCTATDHAEVNNEATTNGSAPTPVNTLHSGGALVTAAGGNVLSAVEPFASQNVTGFPWLLRAFRVASKQFTLQFATH